jgi:hypothetical protein
MGRGSTTRQIGVKKERTAALQSTAGTGSGSQKKPVQDECVFTFETKITVPSATSIGINAADTAVLVPNHSNLSAVDVYVNNKNIGSYAGRNLRKIVSCISQNYVYEGRVMSVSTLGSKTSISVQFQGIAK